MLRLFLSIKTYLWLTGIAGGLFLAGSLYIPGNLDIFSGINDIPLFQWLVMNAGCAGTCYWIYLLIGIMALLGINMIVCSIDVIIKRLSWSRMVDVLSPQVLHAAILLVLAGHFISATAGYREDIPMIVGDDRRVKGFDLKIDTIENLQIRGEGSTRWRVFMSINNERRVLEPGRPSFYRGAGFFIRSAEREKGRAIIGVVSDPGVWWQIAGAAAFVVGAFGVFGAKVSEQNLEPVTRRKE